MDVTLPDLGESIREAEVLKVLVREGDAVAADQPLPSWRPTRHVRAALSAGGDGEPRPRQEGRHGPGGPEGADDRGRPRGE